MDTSEISTIASFHVAFANLRLMTYNEQPVEVKVDFIVNNDNSLTIEIYKGEGEFDLVKFVVKYLDGKLRFCLGSTGHVDPELLSAIAYASRFAEQAFNLVKTHKDFAA